MTSTPKPTSQQSTLKDDKLVIRTQLKAGTMGVILSPLQGSIPGENNGNYNPYGGSAPTDDMMP